jgi:hypothetical protein
MPFLPVNTPSETVVGAELIIDVIDEQAANNTPTARVGATVNLNDIGVSWSVER